MKYTEILTNRPTCHETQTPRMWGQAETKSDELDFTRPTPVAWEPDPDAQDETCLNTPDSPPADEA